MIKRILSMLFRRTPPVAAPRKLPLLESERLTKYYGYPPAVRRPNALSKHDQDAFLAHFDEEFSHHFDEQNRTATG